MHIHMYIYIYLYASNLLQGGEESYGSLNFAKCTGHFPPISPTAIGSFGENDLHHNEPYDSSPPCIWNV